MAFLNMQAELSGVLPGLDPILAGTHINRAYREILDARNWSFLITDGEVICPGQITAGTASITQYSATVTMNAAASAALLPQTLAGAVPGLTNLQIRFGTTSPVAGQVYNIIAVDDTDPTALVLTLDRSVVETTSATSGYQVYRCYVVPPLGDFKAWLSFVDFANAIRIVGDRLNQSSRGFDARDPQRGAQGLAYFLGGYSTARISDPLTGAVVPNPNVPQGTPVYELWPHPTNGQSFYVRWRRKGLPLTEPTDEPVGVDEGLIIQRALGWHSYPWALANASHFPTFSATRWESAMAAARSYYADELLDAKRNDNETQLQDVQSRGAPLRRSAGFGYGDGPLVIDANYLQSHLVRF